MPETPSIRRPWSRSSRAVPTRVIRPAQEFLHQEAAGGIILLVATIVALVWANADSGSYTTFWHTKLTFSVGSWGHTESLQHVVNDGLMALFFFVIGLEVKRELAVGELSDRRAAVLPLLAALGGMLVPAALFLVLTSGSSSDVVRGWGVPMATDIAFALGVLALLGSRVPAALKVLLLGIAVIDDIGAIIVIAIFYSSDVAWTWLLAAVAGLAVIRLLAQLQVLATTPYVVLGLGVWLATYESGIHATIAGVALGLLTPAKPFQRGDAVSIAARRIADETSDDEDDPDKDASDWHALSVLSQQAISPLARLERALHPWTASVVLPLFALANVGVVLDLDSARDAVTSTLGIAVIVGLVLGKPVGIALGMLIAVRLGVSELPDGVTWRHVTGIGCLAGIGFTMSLFVTTLAFDSADLVATSTFAVLVASIVAGAIGAVVLLTAPRSAEATVAGEAGAGAPEVGS
jgi:NhaA family Na+:H+ antiporter